MGIDLDERTGLPVYEGLVDFNGELTDPIELILSLPYIEDTGERMAIADRLAWIADEYCFGINLYQNCTGIWENRATTAGLPYEDAIDEYHQFMPVPETDDPEFANIVNLNWGFSGYIKMISLYPQEGNKLSGDRDGLTELRGGVAVVAAKGDIGNRRPFSTHWRSADNMTIKYVLKKIGMALLTILATSVLTFCLLRAMPGDVFYTQARDLARTQGLPLETAYVQVIQRYNYNPDEPLLQQLGRYYGSLLKGNLGNSMVYQSKTVNDLVAYAMPWTLFISVLSLSITFLLGITLGSLMVWHRKGFLNVLITTFCTITSSIPVFVWAFLLMIVFVFQLGWFPINGSYDISCTPGFNLPFIGSVLYHAVLPVMTYVLSTMGLWALQMKSSGISIMGEDFINAAYARGISDRVIRKRYMMRNAMLPVVTMLAVTFAMMISTGSFVETTYSYPGMGIQFSAASGQRDYTAMQGLLLVMSCCTILANLITEFIYAKLDPRIRVEG